jgi:hypothetical protein
VNYQRSSHTPGSASSAVSTQAAHVPVSSRPTFGIVFESEVAVKLQAVHGPDGYQRVREGYQDEESQERQLV